MKRSYMAAAGMLAVVSALSYLGWWQSAMVVIAFWTAAVWAVV
jgi:hypothetical protein